MTEYSNLIKAICASSIQPLQEASVNGPEIYKTYLIDCSTLRDFTNVDIFQDEEHKPMLDELFSFKRPVLYWFEIVSETPRQVILDAIQEYKAKEVSKATPAIKKRPVQDTSILYVGKVVKGFSGRVVTHLGFYKVVRTQGLQLFHWSCDLNLKLKLHVNVFKYEMAPLMGVIERAMAENLKPLLGKHK